MLIVHHRGSYDSSSVWRWHDILLFSIGFLVTVLVSWGLPGYSGTSGSNVTQFGNSGLSKLKYYSFFKIFIILVQQDFSKPHVCCELPREHSNENHIWNLLTTNSIFPLCYLLTATFYKTRPEKAWAQRFSSMPLHDRQHTVPFLLSVAPRGLHWPCGVIGGEEMLPQNPHGKQIWGEISLLHKSTRHELVQGQEMSQISSDLNFFFFFCPVQLYQLWHNK